MKIFFLYLTKGEDKGPSTEFT